MTDTPDVQPPKIEFPCERYPIKVIGDAGGMEAAYTLLDEAPVASGSKRTPHHLGLVANYDRGPLHAAVSYASTQNTTDLDSAAPIRFKP